MNNLQTNNVGRPTKLVPEMVVKLESILKIGGTIEEACSYALINKTTYYTWIKEDEDFSTKMESAQHYADIVAKNVVVDSMIKDRNLDSAKWWLEKRVFNNQQPLVQINNMKLEVVEDAETIKPLADASVQGLTQV